MKRILAFLTVFAILMFAGSALAATATINVSANVVGTCKVTTVGAVTLAFGDLTYDANGNSAGATLPAGSAAVTFWCTKKAQFSVTDDGGQHNVGGQFRLASDTVVPTEYIPYDFQYTPTSGQGMGPQTELQIDLGATIAAGTYDDVSVDSYSDTVVLTIEP